MVLNDPLSHEQIPAGKTGASTSGDYPAKEGFASSPNNNIMHTDNKSKLVTGTVFDIQTKYNHEWTSIPI